MKPSVYDNTSIRNKSRARNLAQMKSTYLSCVIPGLYFRNHVVLQVCDILTATTIIKYIQKNLFHTQPYVLPRMWDIASHVLIGSKKSERRDSRKQRIFINDKNEISRGNVFEGSKVRKFVARNGSQESNRYEKTQNQREDAITLLLCKGSFSPNE